MSVFGGERWGKGGFAETLYFGEDFIIRNRKPCKQARIEQKEQKTSKNTDI